MIYSICYTNISYCFSLKDDQQMQDFYLFNVHVIEMVLNKLNSGVEVSLVELVGNVPSQRPVLSPFLHDAMEKCHSIQHRLPLHHVADF